MVDGYYSVFDIHTYDQSKVLTLFFRLVVVTVLVAISGEFLVSAIESVVQAWQISETFVGLILLPIVANAAEHVTAVTVAWKNKVRTLRDLQPIHSFFFFPFKDGFGIGSFSRVKHANCLACNPHNGHHRLGN